MSDSGQPMWRSEETAWGAVVSFERQGAKPEEGEEASTSGRSKGTYLVNVLVNTVPSTLPGQGPSKSVPLLKIRIGVNIWMRILAKWRG